MVISLPEYLNCPEVIQSAGMRRDTQNATADRSWRGKREGKLLPRGGSEGRKGMDEKADLADQPPNCHL
jgi:hypothetical protein